MFEPKKWLGKKNKHFDSELSTVLKATSPALKTKIVLPSTPVFDYQVDEKGIIPQFVLTPGKRTTKKAPSLSVMLETFLQLDASIDAIKKWINTYGVLERYDENWSEHEQPIPHFILSWTQIRSVFELAHAAAQRTDSLVRTMSAEHLKEYIINDSAKRQQKFDDKADPYINSNWITDFLDGQMNIEDIPASGYYLLAKPIKPDKHLPIPTSYRPTKPTDLSKWLFESIASIIDNNINGKITITTKLEVSSDYYPYRMIAQIQPQDNLTALWLTTKHYFAGQHFRQCENPNCTQIFLIDVDTRAGKYCHACRNRSNPAQAKQRTKLRNAKKEAQALLKTPNADKEKIIAETAAKNEVKPERLTKILEGQNI